MTTNPRNFPTKLSQSLSFVVSLLSDWWKMACSLENLTN
jgi:hypothetical protein